MQHHQPWAVEGASSHNRLVGDRLARRRSARGRVEGVEDGSCRGATNCSAGTPRSGHLGPPLWRVASARTALGSSTTATRPLRPPGGAPPSAESLSRSNKVQRSHRADADCRDRAARPVDLAGARPPPCTATGRLQRCRASAAAGSACSRRSGTAAAETPPSCRIRLDRTGRLPRAPLVDRCPCRSLRINSPPPATGRRFNFPFESSLLTQPPCCRASPREER